MSILTQIAVPGMNDQKPTVMKYRFELITLLLLACLSVQAQITIQNSDLPIMGDVFSVADSDTDSVDLGMASANAQIWDFRNLVIDHHDTVAFIDPLLTPFGTDFPTADMAQWDSEARIYFYFSHSPSGIFVDGIAIDLSLLGLDFLRTAPNPKELVFPAPVTYGAIINDYAYYEKLIADNPGDFVDTLYKRHTTKVDTIDAWGTFYVGTDTFEVLRIHEHSVTFDTAAVLVGGIPVTEIPISSDTTHTYYFVSDTVRYPVATVVMDGNYEIVDVDFMADKAPKPKSDFFATVNDVAIDEPVSFVNLSAGATNWHWDFGDGNTSTEIEPEHSYAAAGDYAVTLIVSNSSGSDTLVKTDYIHVFGLAQAEFSFTMVNDSMVDFMNTSVNASDYVWDFGDGNTSNDFEPSHTYSVADTYAVKLTASNPISNDDTTMELSIVFVGIAGQVPGARIQLFPNPAQTGVYVRHQSDQPLWIRIRNSMGQLIREEQVAANQPISILGFPKGLYLVDIAGDKGELLVREKLIIQAVD